jgi:hypothetical protein
VELDCPGVQVSGRLQRGAQKSIGTAAHSIGFESTFNTSTRTRNSI